MSVFCGDSRVSLLEWDSRHFGFLVGRLSWAGDAPGLCEALLDARLRGFRLVFVETQFSFRGLPILDGIAEEIFETSRQELAKYLEPDIVAEPSRAVQPLSPESCDRSTVRTLGIVAGQYSRFFRDPRIPRPKAESLFAQWADGGVRGTLADAAFGAFADIDRLVGLILLSQEKDAVRIALLSVLPAVQRRGYGSALLQEAARWAANRNLYRMVVATQPDNPNALSLYFRNGYSTIRTSFISHVWLRE